MAQVLRNSNRWIVKRQSSYQQITWNLLISLISREHGKLSIYSFIIPNDLKVVSFFCWFVDFVSVDFVKSQMIYLIWKKGLGRTLGIKTKGVCTEKATVNKSPEIFLFRWRSGCTLSFQFTFIYKFEWFEVLIWL